MINNIYDLPIDSTPIRGPSFTCDSGNLYILVSNSSILIIGQAYVHVAAAYIILSFKNPCYAIALRGCVQLARKENKSGRKVCK